MWTTEAPQGQRDPFQKLMYANRWTLEELNDLFGEWAMHNVTWDYMNPDGSNQGAIYRKITVQLPIRNIASAGCASHN